MNQTVQGECYKGEFETGFYFVPGRDRKRQILHSHIKHGNEKI